MNTIINEARIEQVLAGAASALPSDADAVIAKALQFKGLSLEETAVLLQNDDPETLQKIFAAAGAVKERIYGRRLVLFAPLYTTNECVNNCLYCAFRQGNKELVRKTLTLEEIKDEVAAIEALGHKRILLVAGEDPRHAGIARLEEIIAAIYEVRNGGGEIRRVNVNVAPLSLEDFKRLKRTKIGTYQIFQETYHRSTYFMVHPSGPKEDYDYRLTAMDRAMSAGIDDVGIGILFGLYDYRFEVLGLLAHAEHLEKEFGVGPHTISVPRLEPAFGAPIASYPPYPVYDIQFKKLVAILRLAVPYTGMILTTRETAEMRNELLGLGISQISAGSRTNPGGYVDQKKNDAAQFFIGDDRSTAEVIADVVRFGYIPSFCTACYRTGRTGESFMEFAKPGEVQGFCLPNALLTFQEYLLDYSKNGLREAGEKVIADQLKLIANDKIRDNTAKKLADLRAGKRDLYF